MSNNDHEDQTDDQRLAEEFNKASSPADVIALMKGQKVRLEVKVLLNAEQRAWVDKEELDMDEAQGNASMSQVGEGSGDTDPRSTVNTAQFNTGTAAQVEPSLISPAGLKEKREQRKKATEAKKPPPKKQPPKP